MILPKSTALAPNALTRAARLRILTRQNGICPWCGHGLDIEDMAAHHRLLRSAGGTWDQANIVGLHHGCHNVQPASVHQEPAKAYRWGFMIRTRMMKPADVPVFDVSCMAWFLLDADWGRTEIPESEALELVALAGGLTRAQVSS